MSDEISQGCRFSPLAGRRSVKKLRLGQDVERQRPRNRIEAAEDHAVLHMRELMGDIEERLTESRFGQHHFRLGVVDDVAQPVALVVRVDRSFDRPQPGTAEPRSVSRERVGEDRDHRLSALGAQAFQGIGPAQGVGIRLFPPQGRSVHMLQRGTAALLRGPLRQHLRHEFRMVKSHGKNPALRPRS